MKGSRFERQRRVKLTFAVLTVALIVSVFLGVLLFFMGRSNPRF